MKKHADLYNFLLDRCRAQPEKIFIRYPDARPVSYGQMRRCMLHAARFMEHSGVPENSRVSILMPNCPEFLYVLFGMFRSGCTAVNLNFNLTEDELTQRFLDAGVRTIFTSSELIGRIAPVAGKLSIPCYCVGGSAADGCDLHFANVPDDTEDLPVCCPNEIAFLQYTGGTTGTIKAAVITHRNVLDNLEQITRFAGDRIRPGEESIIVTLPFYHVFSIVFKVCFFASHGSTILLYPYTRDLPALLQVMTSNRFSFFLGVHTLYKMLLASEQLDRVDFSATRICIGGAEKIQPVTKERWLQRTGIPIYEAYGLTETSSMASCNPFLPEANDIDSIGIPLPGTEFRLLDEQDCEITEDEVAGEILIRGPQVVSAYWNKPEENRQAFHEGWLRTGDIAVRKASGYYKIIDRKKDMINVSGFKVYPNEIESVILSYPGISDCAVIGIPDEKSGERAAAYFVSANETDAEELAKFCKERLAPYKQPVYFTQTESIPKSNVGKTLRYVLRRMAVE